MSSWHLQSPRVAAALAALALFLSACARHETSEQAAHQLARADQQRLNEELFDNAIDMLENLDQFATRDALTQVINRLEQWIEGRAPIEGWRVDPLTQGLSEFSRQLPAVESLAALKFTADDGPRLREAVWLRDASRVAAGKSKGLVEKASALFDWTVREIQLENDAPNRVPLWPWEAMLFGRGTALERAWVFALLARQQELDVVLLATPGQGGQPPEFWCAALLDGEELRLFDPALGLPIPGPGGEGVATLRQAAEDPTILELLSADADHPYPLRAADVSGVIAFVEGSPLYLSERGRLVELRLTGAHRMSLSVDASSVAKQAAAAKHVSSAVLWPEPYDRLARRAALSADEQKAFERRFVKFRQPNDRLWHARALHLVGRYTGDEGAVVRYQESRPSAESLSQLTANPEWNLDQAAAAKTVDFARTTMQSAKQDATYWLGVVGYERGAYDTAADYFQTRVLAGEPGGPWTSAAQYMLGRTLEAAGRKQDAIKAYRASGGPQRHGNLLRAARLEKDS